MEFTDYYNHIHGLVGDVRLVFEFKENLKGIKYYQNQKGLLDEFLDSEFLVRDRDGLSNNKIWQGISGDFNNKIIVGCSNKWFYCHKSVWSPSVDAVFMYNTLLKNERFASLKLKSVLDYGCGTGVMGVLLGMCNPNIKTVYFLDINKYALYSSLINSIGNAPNFHYQFMTSLEDYLIADVGIITPYYFPIERIPRNNCFERIENAGYQSAVLTNQVVEKSKTTYFVYSSITEKQFVDGLKYDFSIIDELWVPFTLGDNVSNITFVESALQHGLLDVRESGQFRYWHKIIVGKIQNKKSI